MFAEGVAIGGDRGGERRLRSLHVAARAGRGRWLGIRRWRRGGSIRGLGAADDSDQFRAVFLGLRGADAVRELEFGCRMRTKAREIAQTAVTRDDVRRYALAVGNLTSISSQCLEYCGCGCVEFIR
jgi:hypothetical protein